MSTGSHIFIAGTTGAALTIHIQLVQLSAHGARLGGPWDEAELHSVEKPGALEVEACLEVCGVHLSRLAICFIEDSFFPSSELGGLARSCKPF